MRSNFSINKNFEGQILFTFEDYYFDNNLPKHYLKLLEKTALKFYWALDLHVYVRNSSLAEGLTQLITQQQVFNLRLALYCYFASFSIKKEFVF